MCGLLVAVLRLSYSLAHEILVPQPRIQPTSPAREGRILSHQTTMEVSTYSFFNLLSVSPVQGLREQGPCQICSFLCSQMQEYYLAHRRHLLQLSWWHQTVNNLPAVQETRFNPWVRKIPWRREWQPTPVFLPGEPHRQKSLAGCSPWGCRVRPTEQLTHAGILKIYVEWLNIHSCFIYINGLVLLNFLSLNVSLYGYCLILLVTWYFIKYEGRECIIICSSVSLVGNTQDAFKFSTFWTMLLQVSLCIPWSTWVCA